MFFYHISREHTVCTAGCCRDDGSEHSTPSSTHSIRIDGSSHRVQIDFRSEDNNTNGSSLDFYEAKVALINGSSVTSLIKPEKKD